MNKTLIFLPILALVAACTDAPTAERALRSAGYSNIQLHGYSVFGCGKDDTFHTAFTATGPTGVRVNGVVCSGVFKGSTIRID